MRFRLALLTMASLSLGTAVGQSNTAVKVRALEPQAGDLERLNLTVAWRRYMPLKNDADTVAVVQASQDRVYVQLRSGLLLAVQAYANPKTFRKPGDVVWQFQPTTFAGTPQPVAVISKLAEIEGKLRPVTEVYAVFGQHLVVLDGADGKMKYTEELPSTAAAGPVADEERVYIPLSNRRVIAYSHQAFIAGYAPPKAVTYPDPIKNINLTTQAADEMSTTSNRSPSISRLQILRPPFTLPDNIDVSPSLSGLKNFTPPYRPYEENRSPSVATMRNLHNTYEQTAKSAPTRIKRLWEVLVDGKITDTPILANRENADVQFHSGDIPEIADTVVTSSGRGVVTMRASSIGSNSIRSEYDLPTTISAPLANHRDSLYVCTADASIVCLSIRLLAEASTARGILPRGKFTTGGPIEQKPLLVDDSLYVIGSRWGLMRLRKNTLDPMWAETLPDGRTRAVPNPAVTKVLAANAKYVYALNRAGALLVLDARRGTTLSTFDVAAFSVPVVNERNDRLFLASPNGLVVCLHDRNLVTPQRWIPGNRDVEAALNQMPKKDGDAPPPAAKKDDPEMKKDDPEMKKDPAPKKGAPKKELEPKEDPKKEVEPKKE